MLEIQQYLFQTFLQLYYTYWDTSSKEAKEYHKDIVSKELNFNIYANKNADYQLKFLNALIHAYQYNKPYKVAALIEIANASTFTTIGGLLYNPHYSNIFWNPDIMVKLISDPNVNLKEIGAVGVPYISFLRSSNPKIELLKLMIQKGLDVNQLEEGDIEDRYFYTTPLLEAIKLNYTEHAVLLIDSGANITYSHPQIPTQPIFAAIAIKNPTLVSYLLEKGVDPHERFKYFHQGDGISFIPRTAIEVARLKRRSPAVLELLKMTNVIITENLPKISLYAAEAVATWYAQYIPGVKTICFSDIYKNHIMKTFQMMRGVYSLSGEAYQSITKEQIDEFVDALSKKIAGESSVYLYTAHDAPEIVEQALEEAGILKQGLRWFPHGTGIWIARSEDGLYEDITIDNAPMSISHTACEDEARKSSSFIFKLQILREETDIYSGMRYLPSIKAECHIVKKCQNENYKIDPQEEKIYVDRLTKLDMYPWNNNDQKKIKELCGLLKEEGIGCFSGEGEL